MTHPTPHASGFGTRAERPALLFVALLLVAVNLRLGVTSASALLTALTDAGTLTPTTVVLIPAIPTAIFAIAGFGTARVAQRLGAERTVLLGLGILAAGLLIRAVPHPWIIVAGTVFATAGLAVVNILLPAVVRAHFGTRIGPVTTAYSTVMSIGASLAAATAVPIASALGSATLGLAAWAVPALIALVVWACVAPRPARPVSPAPATTPASAIPEIAATTSLARRLPPGTALLAAYFALQALLSYVVMGWLPTMASDAGIPLARSGLLLGITMAIGIPTTAVVVALAAGPKRIRIGFSVVALASVSGAVGMLLAPTAAPELWAVLFGIGMSAFPLVLALIAGFGENATESARVSTVVQSVGYSVATLGPLGAGALHQSSGSWSVVLILLIVSATVQCVLGWRLSRVVDRQRAARRTAIPEPGAPA